MRNIKDIFSVARVLLCAVAVLVASYTSAQIDFTRTDRSAPDRLIVKFRENWGQARIRQQRRPDEPVHPPHAIRVPHSDREATPLRRFRASGAWLFRLPPNADIDETIRVLKDDPDVEYAERDHVLKINVVPNDPDFEAQYHLDNTGQTLGTPDADIDAPEAWDIRTDASSVVVAVVDTGVDYGHEDLQAVMWTNAGEIPDNGLDDDLNGYVDDYRGYDFTTMGQLPDDDPADEHGHGTHVAGIIGAAGNNALGVSGVAWNSRIMALKFMNSAGEGWESDAASAIEYATAMGAQVINCSFGGPDWSTPLYDAINAAGAEGVLCVCAAGNDSSDNDLAPSYPATYDSANIISVAASDMNDAAAWFTNYGATTVDVFAPGDGIYSTWPANSYVWLSGTSMSAPVVAGIAAMVKAQTPGLSLADWRNRVIATGDQIAGGEEITVTGLRVNLLNALLVRYALRITDPSPLPVGRVGQPYSRQLHVVGGVAPHTWSWSAPELVEREIGNQYVGSNAGGRDWNADNASFPLALPFPFPYFGNGYDSVWVCTNGFLDFTSNATDEAGDIETFKAARRIAVYWADLRTDIGLNDDIYVRQPDADSICIRWVAADGWFGLPVDVEVTLKSDGAILMNYGPGNETLFAPFIGISAGDGVRYALSAKNGALNLGWAPTSKWIEGSLPGDLTLDAAGLISGTPTAPEYSMFRVSVEDDVGGTAGKQFDLQIKPDGSLHGDFSADPTLGPFPLEVAFTDLSQGTATSWLWNFGDGSTSAERNPRHVYTQAARYTVVLTVSDGEASDETTKLRYINVSWPGPTADFEGAPTTGAAPLTVSFRDLSTGAEVFSWLWDFGDGQMSSERNPVHTYAQPGTYTVELAVMDFVGTGSTRKIGYIVATAVDVNADFGVNTVATATEVTAHFSDLSSADEPIVAWSWSFGDATTSAEQNPTHVYTSNGDYQISLTATDAGGHSDTVVKTEHITLTSNPRTVTLLRSPVSGGTCDPALGSHQYAYGATVALRALPATGCSFERWDGGVANPTAATTTVTADADKVVTARFIVPAFALAVESTPITGVNIEGTPAGTTNYSAQRDLGSEATLTAPATVTTGSIYYSFVRWTVGGVEQPVGQLAVTFNVTGNTSALATYSSGCHLSLKVGDWNLVSLPIVPADPAPATVFGPNLLGVYAWRPTYGGAYLVPTAIEAKRGYWVAVKSDTEKDVQGSLSAGSAVHLIVGWNLVGPISDTVLPTGVLAVYGWDWPGGLPRYVVPTQCLAGHGYWITPSAETDIW